VTVAGEVAAHAGRAPDLPAVEHGGQRLTYAGLAARAAGCAATLRNRGVRGSVAVAASAPIDVLVAVLGAQLASVTAVLLDARWPDAVRSAALDGAGSEAVLEDGDAALRAVATPPRGAPDEARWVVFTSGSAGAPKPILRRRRSWLDSFGHVSRVFGVGARERVLLPGPLSSSLFLFGAMHTLWAGGCCVMGNQLAGATVAHCVPSMLPGLLGVPLALCGGAELPAPLAARAAAAGTRVVEYYGATELSFVAWREAGAGRGLRPFPGVEVEVRRGGQIWVRSPYLAEGPLRRDDRGFATVGDVGAIDATGGLTVVGRADGLILTGGVSVVPEDVERALRALPGVADAVVVGVPHPRLGAIVCAAVEGSIDAAALRRLTRDRLGAAARPRRLLIVERLPRTVSGKPARAVVRELLS
jgi:long-chain acyl-CoA synthetase